MDSKPTNCTRCNGQQLKLRCQINSNGTRLIAWYCMSCSKWALNPPAWLPHDKVSAYLEKFGASIKNIPPLADYSDRMPCIICAMPGELHHWAPQALSEAFGDEWSMWPTAPLCVKHHRQWHDIVTPVLRKCKIAIDT